jgi:hypothetical protein
MDKVVAKAQTMKTAQIKEAIELLANDFRDGADAVMQALLSILEARLPEAEFVEFCDAII